MNTFCMELMQLTNSISIRLCYIEICDDLSKDMIEQIAQ